jgi:hypothetical protein
VSQAAKINQSSVSAIALSSKVKELDTAQSRLRDALNRVGSVLDLKHTITAVEKGTHSTPITHRMRVPCNSHSIFYF